MSSTPVPLPAWAERVGGEGDTVASCNIHSLMQAVCLMAIVSPVKIFLLLGGYLMG